MKFGKNGDLEKGSQILGHVLIKQIVTDWQAA